jgi:hypothetical protein
MAFSDIPSKLLDTAHMVSIYRIICHCHSFVIVLYLSCTEAFSVSEKASNHLWVLLILHFPKHEIIPQHRRATHPDTSHSRQPTHPIEVLYKYKARMQNRPGYAIISRYPTPLVIIQMPLI